MDPSVIGRYEVVRELGRGGMAVVYLARDPMMKRQVAIKVLPRQFTFDPQFRARFQREAELIASLEQSFIVPVYDYGEYDEQPYIVMRYMSGGSLADRLRQAALSPEVVSVIIERIGAAVDYAHAKGVIHRDIKPANILFDSEGNAFLSDFGIAKMTESTAGFTSTATLGTPEYMSPEQALGDRKLDGRTDIYSLGVVLFQMLTGQLPYAADTPMGVAVAHINQPVPDILAVKPSLPRVYGAIIKRAMAKSPDERYQTGEQLAQAVKRMDAGAEDAATREDNQATVIEAVPYSTAIESGTGSNPDASPAGASVRIKPPVKDLPDLPPPAPRRSRALFWIFGGVLGIFICAGLVFTLGLGALRGLLQQPTPTLPVLSQATGSANTPTPTPTQSIPITAPVGLTHTYIEYVLDGSGSMNEMLPGGKTKVVVAREVLSSRAAALPNGINAGLRVFGANIDWHQDKGASCKDIQLTVPIDPTGPIAIIQWLTTFQPKGMTPIAESLRQSASDFTFDANHKNYVVLITDGEEDCGGDPVAAVKYLQELGIDFTIHVIGMSVDAQTRSQLEAIAKIAKGTYHGANTEEELNTALAEIDDSIVATSAQVAQANTPTPPAAPPLGVPPTGTPAPNTPTPPAPAATDTPRRVLIPDIAKEGQVKASSEYSAQYLAGLAIDGDKGTSWFSAGPGPDGTSSFTWTGARDDFITTITILSNQYDRDPSTRKNYGFGAVKINVLDASGNIVFTQDVSLPGTPDPDVTVNPNVTGRSIELIFSDSEAKDCGGFAELMVGVAR